MYPIWTQIIVTDENHHRFGTAGYVVGLNSGLPEQRIVRFDADSTDEAVTVDQIRGL